MKIKNYICKKCGRDNFILVHIGPGPHYGIYCSYCGKWYKWADKGERFLFKEACKNEETT